jgi:tRNA(fMet)-specific endonuclease VapC
LSILLDSDACIAIIRQRPALVRERASRAEAQGERIFVSSISVFELWTGVVMSDWSEGNTLRLTAFLATITSIPFEDPDARIAGEIRGELRRRGQEIGPYDCLIAAQALRRDFLLITGNIREFSRVKGLRFENWTR